MKTKLYFGVLALLLLLSGCDKPTITNTQTTINTYRIAIIDKHEYLKIDGVYGMVHSGSCKQCKYELDSIVRVAIREELRKWK